MSKHNVIRQCATVLAIVAAVVSHQALATVETTVATVDVSGTNTKTGTSVGPPLTDIHALSGDIGTGSIFTNQYTGVGAVSGSLRTVSAQRIQTVTDGIAYSPVFGPTNGGAVFAVTALDGTLSGGSIASFTTGALFIYEASGPGFDRDDPSTWGIGGGSTLLASYTLSAPDIVTTGPDGDSVGTIPAALINKSIVSATPGHSDANLLFFENPAGNFINETSPIQYIADGLLVKATQEIDFGASGADTTRHVLNPADISVLNTIAGNAGLSDLGGGGTGFATSLGGSADGTPDSTYYISLIGEGDLVAKLKADAFIVAAVPEAASLLVWGLLVVGGSASVYLRNRK